jgi:hypothetical protein
MIEVAVEIVRFVESSQPGVIECRLVDAAGKLHQFIDKVPIFTNADLDEGSSYPQVGAIRCQELRRWQDSQGRVVVTVNTDQPDHVESTSGETCFDVLTVQL